MSHDDFAFATSFVEILGMEDMCKATYIQTIGMNLLQLSKHKTQILATRNIHYAN